jgi:hypothetical protein
MNLWNLITRFGDSSLLLPCALLIYGWLLYRREGGDAQRWLLLLPARCQPHAGLQAGLHGLGIGIPEWNFTACPGTA